MQRFRGNICTFKETPSSEIYSKYIGSPWGTWLKQRQKQILLGRTQSPSTPAVQVLYG